MNVLDRGRGLNLVEVILLGIVMAFVLIIAGTLLATLSGCTQQATTDITGATSNVLSTTTSHTLTVKKDAAPPTQLCQSVRVLPAPPPPATETVYKVRYSPKDK